MESFQEIVEKCEIRGTMSTKRMSEAGVQRAEYSNCKNQTSGGTPELFCKWD